MPLLPPVLVSLVSNPFYKTFTRWFNPQQNAYAPTLWDRNSEGFVSPSVDPGTGQPRAIGDSERQNMNAFNAERAQLNQANRNAIDAVMSRFMPISNVWYNHLTDLSASQLISDSSWLADHEQGSDFYNNPDNYADLPYANGQFDFQADYLLARFSKLLTESCLAVDYSEVGEKVSLGVSTPIAIDIEGDGIETTSFLAGPTVYFDIDGDGIKDRTAWLGGSDAFLAIDKNGNGKIDGLGELFGGPSRADGFAQLIEMDSNGDGVVDASDDRFSELLLWQDENIDGLTDVGELVSASSAGLQSINTNYSSQELTNNGNLLGEISTAIFQGKETTAVDVYFRYTAGKNSELKQGDTNIDSLVSAMSAFSAPSAGEWNQPTLADHKHNVQMAATSYFV